MFYKITKVLIHLYFAESVSGLKLLLFFFFSLFVAIFSHYFCLGWTFFFIFFIFHFLCFHFISSRWSLTVCELCKTYNMHKIMSLTTVENAFSLTALNWNDEKNFQRIIYNFYFVCLLFCSKIFVRECRRICMHES